MTAVSVDLSRLVTADAAQAEARAARIGRARAAAEAHIEAVARARHYTSAAACASYVASTQPDWAVEAAAFVAWRDAVWLHVLTRTAEADPPEAEALVAELPALVWP